jgi:hypothetical protein
MKLLSRSEWAARGRVVAVPNSEAKTVVNWWTENARGAHHVFAENQTLPLMQQLQVEEAAA